MGYSPQHMYYPGKGTGTITIRPNLLLELWYDVGRSLIHHGFNKLVFVNNHGSNAKIIEPLLRRLRYDTGAMVAMSRLYGERYLALIDDILDLREDLIFAFESTLRWENGNVPGLRGKLHVVQFRGTGQVMPTTPARRRYAATV